MPYFEGILVEHLHSRPCPVRTSSSNYLACGGLFRAYAGLGSSEKRPPQIIFKSKYKKKFFSLYLKCKSREIVII